eukprot:395745_1
MCSCSKMKSISELQTCEFYDSDEHSDGFTCSDDIHTCKTKTFNCSSRVCVSRVCYMSCTVCRSMDKCSNCVSTAHGPCNRSLDSKNNPFCRDCFIKMPGVEKCSNCKYTVCPNCGEGRPTVCGISGCLNRFHGDPHDPDKCHMRLCHIF